MNKLIDFSRFLVSSQLWIQRSNAKCMKTTLLHVECFIRLIQTVNVMLWYEDGRFCRTNSRYEFNLVKS